MDPVSCFQVVFALREIGGNVDVMLDMCVACSFCQEHFSENIIYQIMVSTIIRYNR